MAVVWQQNLSTPEMGTILVPYLRDNFTWAGGTQTSDSTTHFYINEAKTIGFRIIVNSGTTPSKIAVFFKGSYYHEVEIYFAASFEVEITDTALIFSFVGGEGVTISAANCHKIIVCDGYNTNTEDNEQILIYLKSLSSSNVSAMYASDVTTPADMAEQNGNANVNAKTTNLIPFYNTKSAFITTDVYKSVCEDIGAWYFGNVIVNDKAYRMSGSVFARDI